MDQAKPENQNIYWNQQECGNDSNMDCHVCVFTAGIPQISIEIDPKYATIATSSTSEFV